MVKAGFVQGLITAVITFAMKQSVDALSNRLCQRGQNIASLVIPPFIVCSISLAFLVGLHMAAGKPELLKTISVPISVSFTYASLYSLALWRKSGQDRA